MVVHGNLTVGCMRKQILRKVKGFGVNLKVELYANAEILDPVDDRRLISEVPSIKDRMVLFHMGFSISVVQDAWSPNCVFTFSC